MKLFSRKNKIKINGVSYKGEKISIDDGVLKIDGKLINTDKNSKQIIIHGHINSLETSRPVIEIHGDVKSIQSKGGSFSCNGNISVSNDFIRKASTDD